MHVSAQGDVVRLSYSKYSFWHNMGRVNVLRSNPAGVMVLVAFGPTGSEGTINDRNELGSPALKNKPITNSC